MLMGKVIANNVIADWSAYTLIGAGVCALAETKGAAADMKKVVLGLMVAFGLLITISNIGIMYFLAANIESVSVDKIMEGSILESGLGIISLAITVWIGISIYNALEKDEISKLELKIGEYSSIPGQVKRYTKQQFINQIYRVGDISSDYIAKKFEKDKEIPAERYLDMLTIEILVQRIFGVFRAYEDGGKEARIRWCDTGIKRIERYRGKYEKRYNLEKFYLDYREVDFHFFRAKECDISESYRDYKRADKLYSKSIKQYGIQNTFKSGTSEESDYETLKIGAYFVNTIAQCRAMMLKGGEKSQGDEEKRKEVKKFFEDAISKAENGRYKREVYYRNYGCFIENIDNTLEGKEKAYEQHLAAFSIDKKNSKVYHVLISNLNNRIRKMEGIEMREPEKGREIPLPERTFAGVDKENVKHLSREMEDYLDMAIQCFPEECAKWYAFFAYRKIYEWCIGDTEEKKKYLLSMKKDIERIEHLRGDTALCKVVKAEVGDLENTIKK